MMTGPFYDSSESPAAGVVIADGSITTAMLQNNAITIAKCSSEIIKRTTTAITASNIVNDMVAGITIAPAPGAGLALMLHFAVFKYTYSTAAYAGGSNVYIKYAGGLLFTTALANTLSFASTGTGPLITVINITNSGNESISPTNAALLLYATGAAFTNPGTAAGTATIDTYYSIVTA